MITQNGASLEAQRIFQKDGKDVAIAEFSFENTYKADEPKKDDPKKDDSGKDNPKPSDGSKISGTPGTSGSKQSQTGTSGSKSSGSVTTNQAGRARTGDTFNPVLWIIVLAVGATGVIAGLAVRRKKRKK